MTSISQGKPVHVYHPAVVAVAARYGCSLNAGKQINTFVIGGVPVEFLADNAVRHSAILIDGAADRDAVVVQPLADFTWIVGFGGDEKKVEITPDDELLFDLIDQKVRARKNSKAA